jgi:hypothetical protein
MFKGTTPTHEFEVDIDTAFIKTVKITYSQNDEEILVKRTEDCTLEGNKITTKLTQEDTFLFDCNELVQIQIRGLTHDGEALATDLMVTTVRKCLDDEVLV